MTVNPKFRATFQATFAGVNRPAVRNTVLIATFIGLLALFVIGYSVSERSQQLHSFSHRAQQAVALQDIGGLLARRRGIQAIIQLGNTDDLTAELNQLNQMLAYSLRPLLYESNHLTGSTFAHAEELRRCLSIQCFSDVGKSAETSFSEHSNYVQNLLDDGNALLFPNRGLEWIQTDPHFMDISRLIVQTAYFSEAVARVRGRFSANLTMPEALDQQALNSAIDQMRLENKRFNQVMTGATVADIGLASYVSRSSEHFVRLQKKIAQFSTNSSVVQGTEFFEIASQFIEDLHFLRHQVYQHLYNHASIQIDELNQRLTQIGVTAFVLFLLLIGALLARFQANYKVTKAKNLELSFLKKALDQHAIVSVTDAKGDITYINQRFTDISGYEPEELLGRNHRIINSGVHSKAFFKQLWDSVHSNKPWAGEVCNRCKNGDYYWVYATVLPLYNARNELISVISIRTDITQQKQNAALLQTEKEKADAANKAKGDFLANMSHEIRTPMNAVIGMTHLAHQSSKDEKTLSYLNKIKFSANNLLDIINDILDFSKIEAGKVQIESVPFSLQDTLQQVLDISTIKANEKKLPVKFEHPDNLVNDCIGDPLRLSQVLLNLMGNAVKFTEQGQVTLKVEQQELPGDRVALDFSVADTGIGISVEKQKRLFEAFSQEDTSTTRIYGGTGLGLSISEQLTGLMGAQLTVTSKPGQGSCFSFTLELQQIREGRTTRKLQELRSLYIDDDRISLAAIKRLFGAQGIDLSCCDDAKTGYQLVQDQAKDPSTALDLVLVDQQMPGLDGTSMARMIREQLPPSLQPIIILLTGRSEHDLPTLLEEKLFDAIWLKPVSGSEILDSLQNLIKLQKRDISSSLYKQIDHINIRQMLGAKVLIAEDNLINQEVITGLLEPYGLETTLVNNGLEAVEAVKQQNFDLVLMDLQMPVMDGLQATRKICSLGLAHQAPIVAMTANAMDSDRQNCLNAGMSDHLSKPIDPEKLQTILYQWLPMPENLLPFSERKESSSTEAPCLIEGVNMAVAATSANQDMVVLKRLFRAFIEQYGSFDLYQITEQDLPRELHTLKGLAGTLGMTTLQILASTLEQEYKKHGELDAEHSLLLEQELQRLLAAIQACKDHQDEQQGAAQEADPDIALSSGVNIEPSSASDETAFSKQFQLEESGPTLAETVNQLAEYLAEGDSDAQDIAMQLMLKLQNTEQAPQAAEILELTDSFDFDTALTVLNKLKL